MDMMQVPKKRLGRGLAALIGDDTSEESVVQDARTQDYFSQLLPELGINDVRITTFSEWALELLGLKNYFHRVRPGDGEAVQDAYWNEVQLLRKKDVSALFSDCAVTAERFIGLPKAWIVNW